MSRTVFLRRSSPVLATALLAAVTVTVVAVLANGSAAPGQILDPGSVVRWGQPLANMAVHLAAMVTLGGLILCAVVLPPGARSWERAAMISTVGAIGWTFAQGIHLVLAHAALMGTGLGGPGHFDMLVDFITGIEVGSTLAWAVVLSAVTAVLAALCRNSAEACWAAFAAAAALVPRAGLGHAAGAGNHELAISAMWLHFVGISLWAGGLAVLVYATFSLRKGLHRAASRYSAIAGWGVMLVVLSGAASAWIRISSPMELLNSTWGLLLTVKLVAFAALAAAGWWHRRSTLPQLRDGGRRPFWRLVAVEVVIMGAVVGVSVGLGSSSPPVPQAQIDENAEQGALAPAWFVGLVTEWNVDPLFLVLAGSGAWVYVSWVARMRRSGHAWPAGRTVSWLLSMALAVWATSGGVGVYSQALFSVHMLQHMLVIAVLPIFVVLASPAALAVRALPRRKDGTQGPRELLLSILHSRWAQFFARPLVAAVHVPVSMAVFYLTPLFELAMNSHVVHVAAMAHFFVVGYLFTNVVIGTDLGPLRPFYPVRLVLLLPSMVFHIFFGLFLLSSTTALAADYFVGLDISWTDPVSDQQVGGAVSWAMGELPVIVLAVIVAGRWAAHDERTQQRAQRRAQQRAQRAVTGRTVPGEEEQLSVVATAGGRE